MPEHKERALRLSQCMQQNKMGKRRQPCRDRKDNIILEHGGDAISEFLYYYFLKETKQKIHSCIYLMYLYATKVAI